VDFTFPTNVVIPPSSFVLVVNFDPATNGAAFRAKFGVPANVPLYGPYGGKLDNTGESIRLRRPDAPSGPDVPYILVEEVHYHDSAPWDFIADGFGGSLQRLVPGDFGDDATNWTAAAPSPGAPFVGGTPPTVTQQPVNATVLVASSGILSSLYLVGTTNFTAHVSGSGVRYQWLFNSNVIAGATNVTLTLTNIQSGQAGSYSFLAFNSGGSVVSSNATLTVLTPVTFAISPTNQNVLPGTNVTLVSLAVGTGPVRYQWRFEGTNILNATNASYSFLNANLATNHGNYSVAVADDISSTVSSNAFIYVLVKVGIVTQPVGQTNLQGANFTFSLVATGAPPLWYRWIKGGSAVATSSVPFFTFTNVQVSTSVRVAVTNTASPAGVNSTTVNLGIIPDTDGDGIPDAWELAYFGNITNAVAGADADGDGMSNLDEYRAGTNPTNALSVLKIVLTATNANVLEFIAQTNLSYSVQWRTNFATALWSNLTSITAQSSVRTIQVNTAVGPPLPERYYRIVTPLVP
jgi:hypothetical protein